MNKKNLIKILILAGTASFLVSCSARKDYIKQDLEMPEKFRNDKSVTGDSIRVSWNEFFKDPKLVALIEKALIKNNDISVAIKSIEQLDLAYKQARNSILPTANFNLGANRNWPSKNSLNGSLTQEFIGTKYMDDYNANIQVSWEADIWGKGKLQKESTKSEYFAQKENLSALKTRIISQVAQAYYNLLSLDEQLRIAEENVQLNENSLKMMRLQYQSGQINSLAVEQMEVQKKSAELLIPIANQNIALQENALSILTGEYPDKIEHNTSFEESTLKSNMLSSGIPAQLLSRRPDLKAAEYAVMAANSKTGLAKVAMYPSFSLSPQIGVNSYKFNNWFDLPGSITKTIALNLTQPIFQKKTLKTAYKTALLEQEKAVINFKQQVLTAVGEVSDALAKTFGAQQRLDLIGQKNIRLKKAVKDADLLYKSGMATYLEVITAHNNRLQNDLDHINTTLDQYNAQIELYRALGGSAE